MIKKEAKVLLQNEILMLVRRKKDIAYTIKLKRDELRKLNKDYMTQSQLANLKLNAKSKRLATEPLSSHDEAKGKSKNKDTKQ